MPEPALAARGSQVQVQGQAREQEKPASLELVVLVVVELKPSDLLWAKERRWA